MRSQTDEIISDPILSDHDLTGCRPYDRASGKDLRGVLAKPYQLKGFQEPIELYAA
jgi:hypothetical protein